MTSIPATGAKILSTYATYEQVNGKMQQSGYFILLQDAPLKWASVWQWASILKQSPFKRVEMAYKLNNAQGD